MPGPLPKRNPVRRNRSSTHSTLVPQTDPADAPELPEAREWNPLTLAWWRDVWASPMAPEYDQSDVHGLFMLAALVDQFWTSPSKEIAAEIRLQRQCYGLTPIDRRRLQWQIEHTDEAQAKGKKRRAAQAPAKPAGDDPRSLLRLA